MKIIFDEEICRKALAKNLTCGRDFRPGTTSFRLGRRYGLRRTARGHGRIRGRAEHPVLGYSYRSDAYWNAYSGGSNGTEAGSRVASAPTSRRGRRYRPFRAQAFTSEGDGVVIQPPVYHPFAQTCLNGRRALENPSIQAADGFNSSSTSTISPASCPLERKRC